MITCIDLKTPELIAFLAGAQAVILEDLTKHFPKLIEMGMVGTLSAEVGPRYIRIVKNGGTEEHPQRSAWAFIDRTNGDLLKAASWKAPAKHQRGNILAPGNAVNKVSAYGPAYLR